MTLREWDEMPDFMRHDEVREYYDILKKHETELKFKRLMDVVLAASLLFVLLPVMLLIHLNLILRWLFQAAGFLVVRL